MPQIVPLVVTAITTVTSAVVAAGPLAVAAFNAVNIAGAAALATAAFGAIQPEVKSSSTAIEWNADPNAPNRYPFGRVGGPGNIIHNATFGPDKMYAGFVCVVGCSGPIKGFVGFRADQTPVTFNSAGMAVTSDYAGEMWLIRQRGLQPEPTALPTPSGLKNGAQLTGWGSSYKLSGKAAFMYVLGENSKRSAFQGKVLTPINTFEGLYCYDPRFDSTYPGGSGACRLNNPATWVYSENSYIHALNWNIGRWEGLTAGAAGAPYASMKVGGIGARPEGIDMAAYVEGANVFDENAWKGAAWPDADQSKAAVLDSFLQAGGGIYAERQGRISCLHRAAPRAVVATITADDTAGTIEYDTTTSLLERINTIRPEYWSENHDWQMVATDEVTSSVWREEDGQGVEVTRSKGMAYNYVPGSKQSRELAALQIAHTREPIRGTAPLRHYLDLEVGDCIEFQVPEAILNGQKVIILNVDPDLENDIINVTFCSETDGKYAFAFGQADAPPPMPSITPYDQTVSPPLPGDWVITPRPPAPGGGQQPGLDLTGIVSNSTATAIIVETAPTADGPWTQAYQGPPTVTSIPVDGLQPGATYYIGVQYQRNQNYSARHVYGPYVAPDLISDDTRNVDGLPADVLNARLVSAEALAEQANDTAEEILSGYPSIMDAIGEAIEARDASQVAAENADGSATAAAGHALAAGVSADDAEEHAIAALGSATSAGTSAGQADTYQQQASEAREDAVEASITAGTAADTATGAAGTATEQASLATDKAAEASLSASVAASMGANNANPNSRFSDWTGAAPRYWAAWAGANGAVAKVAGRNGQPNAVRLTSTGTDSFGLIADQTRATVTGGEYVVLSIELTLRSGSLVGTGVYFDARSPSGSVNYLIHNLATTPDATGAVRGAGVAGQTYRWSILRDARGAAIDRYDMIAVARWAGFAPPGAAEIDWHVCGWRPATPEEIVSGVVVPGLSASVSSLTEAVTDLEEQSELARFTLAATTSGGAAILSLQSTEHGTVAGIVAHQIYRGENTFFDDATDTERTTFGTSQRVVAFGPAFGADGTLTEWEGPASVTFSAMSRANAYFYRANVAPYLGGSGFAGTSALRSNIATASNVDTNGATWVTWATCSFADLPAGGTLRISAAISPEDTMDITGGGTLFTGACRVVQNGVVLASGSLNASKVEAEPGVFTRSATIVLPSLPVSPVQLGSTSLTLQVQRSSGANNIDNARVDAFFADWTRTG